MNQTMKLADWLESLTDVGIYNSKRLDELSEFGVAIDWRQERLFFEDNEVDAPLEEVDDIVNDLALGPDGVVLIDDLYLHVFAKSKHDSEIVKMHSAAGRSRLIKSRYGEELIRITFDKESREAREIMAIARVHVGVRSILDLRNFGPKAFYGYKIAEALSLLLSWHEPAEFNPWLGMGGLMRTRIDEIRRHGALAELLRTLCAVRKLKR